MARDNPRMASRGGDSNYNTSNIGGVREERGIVEGIVKANVHQSNMGVISVFIPRYSTDENDRNQWRQVRYCTPFYSRTSVTGPNDDYTDVKSTAGLILPQPDLGTKVLCFFPEGRNADGYYFACVPDLYMMQTLPEVTVNAEGVPSSEFNDINSGANNTSKITSYSNVARPVHKPAQESLVGQGLEKDAVRGKSTSSYMRESPSELIGIATKGRRIDSDGSDLLLKYNAQIKAATTTDPQVLEKILGPRHRRKGHTLTMDDGDIDGNSNQIRLRTSTGHQILLNDDKGVMYFGNAAGTVWIELANTGTVDVYAADSINFRSKNINFHADENIKMHSGGFTQLVSDNQMHMEGKKGIAIQSGGEVGISAANSLHISSGSAIHATSAGPSYYSGGSMISVAATGIVMLQGPKAPAKQVKPVTPYSMIDTEGTPEKGYAPTCSVVTTVDRITAHEPFNEHGIAAKPTPYSGGLVGGGGGGIGGFFAILGPLTSTLGSISSFGTSLGSLGTSIGGITGLGALPGQVGGFVNQISGSIGQITGQLDGVIGQITGQLDGVIGQITGSPLGQIVGQIDNVIGSANGVLTALGKDTLGSILDVPIISQITSGDILKNLSTGFDIGVLGSDATRAINSVVTNLVGANGAFDFVNDVTKAVGKYGFTADQLQTLGFVRPDAIFNDQLADASLWTGKDGVNSLGDLLNNPNVQEIAQQALTASHYQSLVNVGAILDTDPVDSVMGMITGSLTSNPTIAALIRGGESIESLVKNTTNILNSDNPLGEVVNAIRQGSAASTFVSSGLSADGCRPLPTTPPNLGDGGTGGNTGDGNTGDGNNGGGNNGGGFTGPINVPNDLLSFIKSKEGFSATAYWDNSQYTNGYGTKANSSTETITMAEASRRLGVDVTSRRNFVVSYGKSNGYKWNNDQINALTSFVYNLGTGALAQVTANGTRTDGVIAESMKLYNKANGQVLVGLSQRRNEESAWFKRGINSGGTYA